MIESKDILALCGRFESYLVRQYLLPLKFCACCREWKSKRLQFHKSTKSRDGHQGHCKECNKKSVLKYSVTDKGWRTKAKARAKYQKSNKFKAVKEKYKSPQKGRLRIEEVLRNMLSHQKEGRQKLDTVRQTMAD
jgi:hypothetical protein